MPRHGDSKGRRLLGSDSERIEEEKACNGVRRFEVRSKEMMGMEEALSLPISCIRLLMILSYRLSLFLTCQCSSAPEHQRPQAALTTSSVASIDFAERYTLY